MTIKNRQDWEDLCDGCGMCCEIRNSGVACPQLDVSTNRCKSYANRVEAHPACLTVTPANVLGLEKLGVLPSDCPYVRTARGLPVLSPRVRALRDKNYPARFVPMQLAENEFQLTFYKDCEEFRQKFRPSGRPFLLTTESRTDQ